MNDPVVEGRQRLTFRIDQMELRRNPEIFGRGEWTLVAFVDGHECWRTPERLRGFEGERVPVDGSFHIDVAPHTNMLELRIEATEHDLIRDDHAYGGTRLFRSMDFGGSTFYVDLEGDDAAVRLLMSAAIN